MQSVRTFWKERRGAGAAEFAIVVLLFVGVVFAIIDFGRAMWQINMVEKATQMGVRLAVVNDFVPATLQTWNAVTALGIPAGSSVPITAINPNPIICVSGGCSAGWGYNSVAFDAIVTRMQGLYAGITPASVTVEYRHIGLSLAGSAGPDIDPLVTVRVSGLPFNFMTPLLNGLGITMPDFVASLTSEDSET